MAFDKKTYDSQFHKETYDRITFSVPKGKKAELEGIAADKGVSLTRLIIDALEKQYQIYLGRDKP